MPKIPVYNQEGKEVGSTELNPALFAVAVKPEVVRQAVIAQQANSRSVVAHVKTRAEVRGGGRKPWRQKGTGRARHGSIRSPLWVGGGKTFGPRNIRNFSQKINKKLKRKALAMALSDKAHSRQVIVLDQLVLPEAKTKLFAAILKKLPIKKPSVLTVLPAKDLTLTRASSNLPHAKTITANSLNIVDVLKHRYLLVPQASLPVMEKTFAAGAATSDQRPTTNKQQPTPND